MSVSAPIVFIAWAIRGPADRLTRGAPPGSELRIARERSAPSRRGHRGCRHSGSGSRPSRRNARRRAVGSHTGSRRHGSADSSCASARAPRPVSGYVALRSIATSPPGPTPNKAGRGEPTASSTATASCIQSSKLGISPLFERVREPDAARIEPDQSTERREPPVEARPVGLVVAVDPDAAAVAERREGRSARRRSLRSGCTGPRSSRNGLRRPPPRRERTTSARDRSSPSHRRSDSSSAFTALVMPDVNVTSSWIALTRSVDALRSAIASTLPTSASPWSTGSA